MQIEFYDTGAAAHDAAKEQRAAALARVDIVRRKVAQRKSDRRIMAQKRDERGARRYGLNAYMMES